MKPGMMPTAGYDSHSSANFLEFGASIYMSFFNSRATVVVDTTLSVICRWFLFNEDQCVPRFILQIKAFEDRRTATNDEKADTDRAIAPFAPPSVVTVPPEVKAIIAKPLATAIPTPIPAVFLLPVIWLLCPDRWFC